MISDITASFKRFAAGEIDLCTLEDALDGRVRFHFFDTNERSIEILDPSLPSVVFSAADIEATLRRFLRGDLTRRQVSDWAAVLRMLDAYELAAGGRPDTVWNVLDELMAPDAWGELSTESAIKLLRDLE